MRYRLGLSLCLLVGLTLFPLNTQATESELRIGLIPEMNVFSQLARFNPLAEYLSEQAGLQIKFTILSRYGNIIDRFKAEGMDGAFLGSFTGALAIQQLQLEPLVRPVNLDGKSTYHGHIYTRKDSGVRTVADMRGKKFAFVEKATTAGYLFPLAFLRAQGVTDFRTHFSEHYFAGSHDASINAVLNRKADVGASKNTVYDWIRKTDPRIDQELVVLAESGRVPSNGLCIRADLAAELKQKIRTALLSMNHSAKGQAVLEQFKALKFIPASHEDYQPVFEMAEQAGLDLKSYRYENR